MNSIFNRLDEIEETVMGELKDFQVATVERIDYLYRHGQNRILISDEVGLGKTLVARGTIAKFAKLRRDEGDNLVKVVYICSNATIAEQNLDKLRIVNELRAESTHTSRLSMQHLNIFNQENDPNVLNRYIQLIPLTPETSFKVSNSQGTVGERALMLAILNKLPTFRHWRKQLEEIFRFGVYYWEGTRDYYEDQVKLCNERSNGEYIGYMQKEVLKHLREIRFEGKTLLDSLKALCRKIRKEGFVKRDAKPLIVRLRIMFADISLNKLEPDLIIMDEFQRFKYLLGSDKNSEMDRLVNKFFNSEDMRILMLSATPYKMYSTLDEIDEEQIDAHYSEFFNVMDFLNECERERIKFREVWNNYSIELKEFNRDNDSFILAKTKAENAMFKSICRTERITEAEVVDIVDDGDTKLPLKVFKEDIQSFMEAQKLLDEIGLNNNVPIDYIKSSPYLMSFMKNYQLKRRIERYFQNHANEIPKMKKSTFWLNYNDINNYKVISPNNARLNDLMNHVLKGNAEKLLWIPPSHPYYPCEGVFEGIEDFSKTLIFSSWEMVPRMISSMVSYEVERRTIGELENKDHDVKYFAKSRYPSPRLNFNLNEDKPAQMSLFTLIYPSIFLADVYDPIDCLNRKLSLKEIENEVKSKIEMELDRFHSNNDSREDARWYYLAPLLLDNSYSKDFISIWFDGIRHFFNEGIFSPGGFLKHFELLKDQFREYSLNPNELGRKPDDLADVLCDMAIASPAICIYRSYKKESVVENSGIGERGILGKDSYGRESIAHYSKMATQVARRFLSRMNTPESIAVIDLIFKHGSEDAYWQNLLKYSKHGNLQAVFDEYVHLLSNGLDENNKDRILIINHRLLSSMEIRAASYDFDTYKSFSSRMRGKDKSSPSLRTHFAVSFTKGRSDQRDTNRKKTVRDAFNSPFRPFVLASTSIGQEGLDFHNYCRRIVHWNLPSNPIDLEQREGRINRFECLTIRQNIAKRYRNLKFETDDIWKELFEEASAREKVGECSDLIPYWGLKDSDDMIKIERIVPMYPFSRDEIRYDRLIKILSLYRLTLGQSRQEQILENIFNNLDDDENRQTIEDIQELFINLSPYYKRDVEDFEIDCEEIEEEVSQEEIKEETNQDGNEDNNEDLNDSVDERDGDDLVNDDNDDDFVNFELIDDSEGDDEDMDIKLKYCFNCGAELVIKGAKFCYNCGQDLRVENLDSDGNPSDLIALSDESNKNESTDSLDDSNKEFIIQISPEILENNRCNGKELQKISQDAPKLGDLKDYWANIRQIIIENNLFNGNFIKWADNIYWMPINNVPLNLARIEFLVFKGFIETKLYISWDKNLYLFLKNKKDEIERELGSGCEFFERGNVKASKIAIYNKINLNDMDCWNDAMSWHIYMGKRFYDIFSNMVENYYSKNHIEYNHLRGEYWKELDNRLDKKDLISMDIHHKWANYPFIIKNFGWNEVRLVLTAYTNHKKIQVGLACNGDIFNYLLLQKKDIEDELGFGLKWKGGKWHSDIFVIHRANIRDKNNWEESINWHLEMVDKFKKVFIPRISEFYNR